MKKKEFIKVLIKRVEKNSTELLDFLSGDEDNSFSEWMHFITDSGIEELFHEYKDN